MKKTIGIVRNTDDLGRIVIPAEMRRTLGIEVGEALEMVLHEDGLFVRKYAERQESVAGKVKELKALVRAKKDELGAETAGELYRHLADMWELLEG